MLEGLVKESGKVALALNIFKTEALMIVRQKPTLADMNQIICQYIYLGRYTVNILPQKEKRIGSAWKQILTLEKILKNK